MLITDSVSAVQCSLNYWMVVQAMTYITTEYIDVNITVLYFLSSTKMSVLKPFLLWALFVCFIGQVLYSYGTNYKSKSLKISSCAKLSSITLGIRFCYHIVVFYLVFGQHYTVSIWFIETF